MFSKYLHIINEIKKRTRAKELILLRINSIAFGAKRPWTIFLFADYCSFAVHSYSPIVIVWVYMLYYYLLVGLSSSNLFVDVRPSSRSLVMFRGESWKTIEGFFYAFKKLWHITVISYIYIYIEHFDARITRICNRSNKILLFNCGKLTITVMIEGTI